VRESKISMAEAEAQTIAFLEQWVPKGKSPICGNSICQDRRFLYATCALESYFHYRNLDVSTLKELAARWAPDVRDSFKKGSTHLALDDIRESIAELRTTASTSSRCERNGADIVGAPLWCPAQLVRLRAFPHGPAPCC
jgi:oligoribonuclease